MCWKVDFCLFARENVPESCCFSFLKIQLEILKFNAYTLVFPVYRNSTNLATQKSLAEELEMKNFLGKRRLQSQHSGRTTPLGTKTSGTTTFRAAKTIEISFPSATRWALFVWLGDALLVAELAIFIHMAWSPPKDAVSYSVWHTQKLAKCTSSTQSTRASFVCWRPAVPLVRALVWKVFLVDATWNDDDQKLKRPILQTAWHYNLQSLL